MSTAILKFDLNDPDDRRDHLCCVHAKDLALAVWELRYNVRKDIERMLEKLEPDGDNIPDGLMRDIWNRIEEVLPDINIDDLVN